MILLLTVFLRIIPFVDSAVSPTCPPDRWLKTANSKFSCCDYCPPGQYMVRSCNTLNRTVCAPCRPNSFTAQRNTFKACLQCSICHETAVVTSLCSREADTRCLCKAGYFYNELFQSCGKCKQCGKGQFVSKECGHSNDRVCASCELGVTFLRNGLCLACKTCQVNEVKRSNCNMTTDAVCQKVIPTKKKKKDTAVSSTNSPNGMIIGIVLSLVLFFTLCAVIGWCICRRKCTCPFQRGESPLPTLNPDVIRVPVPSSSSGYAQVRTTVQMSTFEDTSRKESLPKTQRLCDLSYTLCRELGKLLNPDTPDNNWKVLACKMGMKRDEISSLEKHKSPTLVIIREYQAKRPDTTVWDLRQMLLEINRHDAAGLLILV